MRAAVCRAFGAPLTIEDITLADPGPDEVRVKMTAVAICHSDITLIDGGWGGGLPAVFGHEGAGIVETVGPGVSGIAVGDSVVVTLIRSCGVCHGCSIGQPVRCTTQFSLDANTPLTDAAGEKLVHGLRTAAFAEYTVVHKSQLVVVSDSLPKEAAALLACGVITGFGAVTNTAQVPSGADVVVIGAGGVGLNSVQAAKLAGARTVTAIDLVDTKLDAALTFGATHTLNSLNDDVPAGVRRITDDRGADYIFVTVGAKAAFDQPYDLLARGGALVIVGMPPSGVNTEIDPGTIAALSQRILGSKMGSARIQVDIPMLASLYDQDRLLLDELVSGTYALEQINEAISSVKAGTALRNVIVF